MWYCENLTLISLKVSRNSNGPKLANQLNWMKLCLVCLHRRRSPSLLFAGWSWLCDLFHWYLTRQKKIATAIKETMWQSSFIEFWHIYPISHLADLSITQWRNCPIFLVSGFPAWYTYILRSNHLLLRAFSGFVI